MHKRFKQILSAMTLFIVLSLLGCGRTAPIQEFKQQPVPSNISSKDEVKSAIAQAGASLGWIISEKDDNTLSGTLNLRSHTALISIPYSSKGYSLMYFDSENLKYDSEDLTIHKNFNSWLRNLNKRIQSELIEKSLQKKDPKLFYKNPQGKTQA